MISNLECEERLLKEKPSLFRLKSLMFLCQIVSLNWPGEMFYDSLSTRIS